MSRRTPHLMSLSRRPAPAARQAARKAARNVVRPVSRAGSRTARTRPGARQGSWTTRAARTVLAGYLPGVAAPAPTRRRRLSARRILTGGLGLLALTAIALLLRRRTVLTRLARGHEPDLADRRGLDALTGLPNRAEGIWWLNTRLARAQSRGHRLALMILDLDGFAEVNAVHGRAVGDHVLQVTAARMQAQLRTGDMVCRVGNDTFMVIMDAVGPDHRVAQVGARVVAAVGEPLSYHSDTLQVTASMGFAVSQDRDRNADLLLDRADRALIQAKSSARNIVQF